MRIEATKQAMADLPITLRLQAKLRETARLLSTHYSTQIEGNRLTLEEANLVIKKHEHFPGRQRDEAEVLGYYAALDELEKIAAVRAKVLENSIQKLHALVMSGKKKGRVKPTPYRDGQNVIRDSGSGAIVYLPPEAKDVPSLMSDLLKWVDLSDKEKIPCPIRAAIAHYQFATIHPYYDGNGRTARLLTTLILHLGGYGLKGLFSLEEYYARNLSAYYKALTIGPSHNYYVGRADAEITSWIEYFCMGMAEAFESVVKKAKEETKPDQSKLLRELDAKKRRGLALFQNQNRITSSDVATLFGLKSRTARDLCQKWVKEGFLVITDPSKKARQYRLVKSYLVLVD